jgi:hypothetical protein
LVVWAEEPRCYRVRGGGREFFVGFVAIGHVADGSYHGRGNPAATILSQLQSRIGIDVVYGLEAKGY